MKIKLINTTSEVLDISDIGLSLLPNSTTDIDTNLINLSKSRILFRYISDSTVIVNNYERNLLPSEGVLFIVQGTIEPKDSDGKLFVHQTSRVPGCMTYWTGRGDKSDDPLDVGNGQIIGLEHNIGDPTEQIIYVDFNCVANKTYLHEGYIFWKDAEFGDFISLSAVTNTVSYVSAENTNFNLYGGFLVIPAAGDGTIQVTSDISDPSAAGGSLVQVYTDETGYRPPAYWNADYNSSTGRFENITAAPLANGEFNMYTIEIPGNRFVNHIPILGSGFEMLQSSDSTFFPHGLRIKCTINTTNDDHKWSFGGILTMHREKTI